jgi:drug/metabolite transporter (DMT)-like permease
MPAAAPARPSAKLRDWSLLLFCNFVWASQFALVKLVQDEVGPLFATAFPMLVATVLLMLVVWRPGRAAPATRGPLRASDLAGFATIGVLGQAVAQLCSTWGAQRSLASNAAVLSLSLPVATALMAFLLLGERMTLPRWIGFALALAGVWVSSGNDFRGTNLTGGRFLLGNSLVFLGVLGSAFYNVYSKRMLVRFTPLEVLLGSYLAACALLVPIAALGEPGAFTHLASLSGRAWCGLLVLAGFHYCLSMVVFLTVLTRLDATQAAVSNYLIPGFGLLIAWQLLGERLPVTAVVGGLLVLLSTLLVTVWEDRLRARPSP